MSQDHTRTDHPHYTCLGIGAGPANLSLASLLHGHPEVSNLFLDRRDTFGWHDGQQIPGATLQVSLFKDLVSLTDPTNRLLLPLLPARARPDLPLPERPVRRRARAWSSATTWSGRAGGTRTSCSARRSRSVEFDRSSRSAPARAHGHRRQPRRSGVGTQPLGAAAGARPASANSQFHVSEFLGRAELAGRQAGRRGRRRPVRRGGLPRPDLPAGSRTAPAGLLDLPAPQLLPDRRLAVHQRLLHARPLRLLLQPGPGDPRAVSTPSTYLTSDGISEATLREIYQRIYVHRFIERADDLVAL